MKGVIVDCVHNMVVDKYGQEKWDTILEEAGIEKGEVLLVTDDIEDQKVMRLFQGIGKNLQMDFDQIAEVFGDYWINSYTSKNYPMYYRGINSTKDFLLNMDKVHQAATKSIPNAKPPRFDYNWKQDNVLAMHYKSERGLIDLMIGVIKGVAKYYQETIDIKKIDETEVEITFPE
ncbi:heme NO-binding domain-containing protein [Patescibacteria group bacterium]|nr:heme NO-binding domain-containing protein [Patescibacteria group bacterium]